MNSLNYFLVPDANRQIISHGETGLRVNVYHLENEPFYPVTGELHIFGDDHGEWLAFETEGYHRDDLQIFASAVTWYARYLDYPGMQIETVDPRPEFKLKIT